MNLFYIKNIFILLLYIELVKCQVPAKPLTTKYDQDIAKKMLRLSAGAYAFDPSSCINEAFNNNGNIIIFNNQTTTCDKGNNPCSFYSVIDDQNKEIFIVFRGTKTNDQLLREGISTLIDGPDFHGLGVVNFYFNRAHNTLWDSVKKIFEDPKYNDYKVYVTGHSLGGALAALCAVRIRLENYRNSSDIYLYTFGEPRVGSSKFAFNFDELVPNSWRVIHSKDIVPHLPACGKSSSVNLLQKFIRRISEPCDPNLENEPYHHGTEIWYPEEMGETDTFMECTGTPKNEDFSCSDQFIYDLSKLKEYAEDHRHYFNHKVPAFGKLGCLPGLESEEEALSNDE
uniref:Lipase_3 domain-containing protein n=1 Tax=Strongyloides venezuelensis TaxID=75913 RepID=A0A0K0F1Q3_STRVS